MGGRSRCHGTDIQGKIAVSTGDKQHPGENLAQLKPGEELRIEGGGLTLVYFQFGREHRYSDSVRIRLGARQQRLLSGSGGKTSDFAIALGRPD